MTFKINKPLAPNGGADEYDVKQLKKVLNRLGYYTPFEVIGITGIPDRDMFDALRRFQEDKGLPVTGSVTPDDPTEAALREESAKTPEGYYIWRAVEDDKVRSAHAAFNRKTRAWSDSPDPGEDYNCRCWAESVKDDLMVPGRDAIEPTYPEILLIPLLRTQKLYALWRLWVLNRNTDWILGSFKSETRWGNQLRNRNWTPEDITNTIKYGRKYPAPNKITPENGAMRYEYQGRFVVRDNVTKEILQVSGPRFTPNKIQ